MYKIIADLERSKDLHKHQIHKNHKLQPTWWNKASMDDDDDQCMHGQVGCFVPLSMVLSFLSAYHLPHPLWFPCSLLITCVCIISVPCSTGDYDSDCLYMKNCKECCYFFYWPNGKHGYSIKYRGENATTGSKLEFHIKCPQIRTTNM